MLGTFVLISYAVIMLLATLIFTKRAQSKESFHVADRNIGTWIAALSIAATWIWAPALFTSAEKAYTSGIPGIFWFLVPNVLCLILFIPFAVRIRERVIYDDHQRNDHEQRRPYNVRCAEKLLTDGFLFHSLIPPRPQ